MTRHRSFAPSTGAFVVVPEENEKSEPFSNRKQVRIFLVWWEYQVGLFALLRGHTQLVVLETEEGVHAFTRAVHAFLPELSAPPEELAARLLYQISQQELTLKKLMKCSAPALQTLL